MNIIKKVLFPILVTVGHIPMEISRLCHYFLASDGVINGYLVDVKPRRSPIPSAGLEVRLELQFSAGGKYTLVNNEQDAGADPRVQL